MGINDDQKMLDKDKMNVGYLCGRLIAVIEKTGVNLGVRMDNLSMHPAYIMPHLLRETLEKESYIKYRMMIMEIVDKIPSSGFPARLNMQDQGNLWLGYYHQKSEL